MEALVVLVNEVFNEKSSYKEGDYIVIMNILKEAYHIIKGEAKAGNIVADKELEVSTDEESDEEDYSDSYLQSYLQHY